MVRILVFIFAFGSLAFNEGAYAMESAASRKERADIVYKILTLEEWNSFEEQRIFKGSKMDQKDGFIHAARDNQYQGIVNKFFKDIRPIVVVKLNAILLKSGSLKIESNRPGGDKSPHIYGDIPCEAIMSYEIVEK